MPRLRKGKIIIIEGGDGAGKATQASLLVASLNALGVKAETRDFPRYSSATGKVVGGAYLGKSEISESYFREGAGNVDWRVASLYYAADRLYNIGEIRNMIDSGVHVVLDRYVFSNMAYQASKTVNGETRQKRYDWLDTLEYGLLGLPRPDIGIYLEVPVETSMGLMDKRKKDEHEKDERILRAASVAYREIAARYNLMVVDCVDKSGELRSRESIAGDVLSVVADILNIKLPKFEAKFFWD
ncbi:deoxynucleoside kinase [Candidatus Saccharibacteria bacterium]|nr:deoxynucleoside kinase [Candidatus Saccharibacteria bacterium]